MSGDEGTLLEIVTAADYVLEFVDGIDAGRFAQEPMRWSAVLYQLVVMGEATKRLSAEFRDANPQITWGAVAGLRDVLVHAYHRVSLEQVWEIEVGNVRPVADELRRLLTARD